MRIVWASLVIVAACGDIAAVSGFAADLEPRTVDAYERYVDHARQAFVHGREAEESNGRIVEVPGGLVHHWTGVTFIAGVDLRRVVGVAQAYDRYATVYRSIVTSTLTAREGDTFHVFARLKEDAGLVSAVLEIRTVVVYEPEPRGARSIGTATEIRQVKNAGSPHERLLPEGRDSGYLWRATTFTRFVEREAGVYVQVETIGLSRRFPPLLGWLIEPIARRLGRASVERTLTEFRAAVLAEES